MEFTSVVDGGYATFVYGSRDIGAWNNARLRYRKSIILMDNHTFRSDIFPNYKAHRKVKRDADQNQGDIYEQVQILRKYIWEEDSTVRVASVWLAEADDLVSAFHLVYPDLETIVAVDKDLQQIPNLAQKMVTVHGEPVGTKEVLRKVPLYISRTVPEDLSSPDLVLLQSLFGDRSDSIPRLLPSKPAEAIRVWTLINSSENLIEKYLTAFRLFGSSFIMNLQLILVPGNPLRNRPIVNPTKLMEEVCTRFYWHPSHYTDLVGEAFKSMEKRALKL